MVIFLLYTLLIISIISIYSFLIFKKIDNPTFNLYLITNIIIFYIPALLYSIFGFTHPSVSYNEFSYLEYKPIIFHGLLLIFIFDSVVIISYFNFFNKFNYVLTSSNLPLVRKIDLVDNFKIYFLAIFFSVICFDTVNLIVNNPFMNKNFIYCNTSMNFFLEIKKLLDDSSFIANFKQPLKEFAKLKFYLLIITIFNYFNKKTRTNFYLLLIILFYNLILAISLGSRFQIALVFIILFCINFSSIIKFKNLIYTFISFFFFLYLFPIIGAYRSHFTKNFNSENCIIAKDLIKSKIDLIKYNNITLQLNDGIINNFDHLSVIRDNIFSQTFINKPLEIILSRLNYFDITLRTINFKLNNYVENNFNFYFDNFYALIPRILYQEKNIITNNANFLAVELGVFKEPIHAVGLRPIAEGYFYVGYYYLIIAIILGFIFYTLNRLFNSTNILIKSMALYSGILIVKRDSFHALLPGMIYELFVLIYLLLITYLINIYKQKKIHI